MLVVGAGALVGGVGVMGAQALAKEGLIPCVRVVAEQIVVNAGRAVASNITARYATELAQAFGADEDMVRAGADAIQLFSLVKAARASSRLQGAGCFAAGTVVQTANGPVPIEQLQIGQRVLTEVQGLGSAGDPPPSVGDPNATHVDPETWREVDLVMPDPNDSGNDYRMQLLEPLSWVQQMDARAGQRLQLSLPELGISGDALITSVEACPEIAAGDGRVILGTFQHEADSIVHVALDGVRDDLVVTVGHKIWSIDRGGWVAAGALNSGEMVATLEGVGRVTNTFVRQNRTAVYNLDIETDHRYLVGESGVLAHNEDATCNVPQKATDVRNQISQNNGTPPPGYKGGKTFMNDGRAGSEILPPTDPSGAPITYKEYDINPFTKGVNRGAERVVIGSDGSSYYTGDHYKTFTKMGT